MRRGRARRDARAARLEAVPERNTAGRDDVGARILAGLRELLARRPESGKERESSLLGASERVGEQLRRWERAGRLLRRLGTVSVDRLAAPGQWLLLSARTRGLGGAVVREVRFLLEERTLGTAPVEPDGQAHLAARAPSEPGLYRLAQEPLGPAGSWGMAGLRATGRLQVVAPDVPLLLVEAAWAVRSSDRETASHLRRLTEAGVAVAYVGLGERSSAGLLRERMAAGQLPEGAWIPFGAEEADPFERELLGAFVSIAIRRLRAEGLYPVGVLVRPQQEVAGVLRAAGVPCWPPEMLREEDASRLVAWRREATSRMAERGGEEMARRLEAMTGAQPVGAEGASVTLDNARARAEVLGAIEAARREVLLQSYMVEDGRVADAFAAALIGAARRGARVRVLVDALYARHHLGPLRNPVLEALDAVEGIEVRAVDPPLRGEELDPLRFKARDHRKLLVVDGEVAFVGGRNVGDAYYVGFEEVAVADFTPHERVPWLDAHVRLHGPVVAAVRAAFLEGWARAGGLAGECERTAGLVSSRTGGGEGGRAWFVTHEGLGDARALGAYEALFDGARRRLLVLNDFPIVDALEAALRRAVARGVRVTFLTGSAVARRGDGSFLQGPLHRELFEYMTKHRFEALVRAGADVREAVFRGDRVVCRGGAVRPYVHAKLVVVDDRWVSVGSANLDATASYWEREAVVVLDAPELAARLLDELARWLTSGRRIRLDEPDWRREAPLRRLAAALWPQALYS